MTGSEKNTRQSKKQKQGKAFVLPAYEKGKKIIQGSLVIAVPDGFEDYDKDGAVLIKNEDDLLCISVSELSSGDIDISWPDQADADKAAMLSKIGNCKNVRIFMENDNITLAYGKNGEAGKDEEPYWKSYSLIFLTEASAWLFELRFNYRRSTAKNYNTAVEDFGSRLALVPSKHITREVQIEETKTAAAEPGPQVVGNVLQSAKADEGVLTAEEAV
ncbi:MAG: hypothetical protein J6X66_03445, partial [Lachnospiraceae bacterium]|nr:hypothetical protein [Lachnospiraceae bacterium]